MPTKESLARSALAPRLLLAYGIQDRVQNGREIAELAVAQPSDDTLEALVVLALGCPQRRALDGAEIRSGHGLALERGGALVTVLGLLSGKVFSRLCRRLRIEIFETGVA
jgi:hypothetical protein